MFQPITRQQILDLKPGSVLQYRINGILECEPHPIDEVETGENGNGHAWAVGCVQFSTCRVSFGILENETQENWQLIA